MSVLRKLAGQTAIYGLSMVILLSACSTENTAQLEGTWRIADRSITETRYMAFHRNTWFAGVDSMALNGQGDYRLIADSIFIHGEMENGNGTAFSLNWSGPDHLVLSGTERQLTLERVKR